MSHTWPNHYKVLQTLNQVVTAKRQGLPLDQFSIYTSESFANTQEKISVDKKVENSQHGSISKLSP